MAIPTHVKQESQAVSELCERCRVRRLELFGSAARDGSFSESSDLDFVVKFDEPADGDHFGQYFDLREGLESIFGREIDVVQSHAVRNPYFQDAIDEDRVLIYAA